MKPDFQKYFVGKSVEESKANFMTLWQCQERGLWLVPSRIAYLKTRITHLRRVATKPEERKAA